MSNSLYIFKTGEEVSALQINYNFRLLLNYLSAISTDSTLVAELARSTELADLVANAIADNLSLVENIVDAFINNSEFLEEIIELFSTNLYFLNNLVSAMASDETFIEALVDGFSSYVSNFDNTIADLIAQDTRGVNTRTDIGGSSASLGGDISYLSTDSGTIRTKKSDEDSVDDINYNSSTFDIEGDYWKVVIDATGTLFDVWRYDTEDDFLTYGYTRADLHKAGPQGTVGQLFTTIQFLDTNTSLYRANGSDRDKTTGRIYGYDYSNWSTLTDLPDGIVKIYTASLRVISTSPNEVFTFKTYNINLSDNGFITNIAHAIMGNDTLSYEISRNVIENPNFVTELSQNLQKVRICIQTEVMGNGSFNGQYTNLILDQIQSGIVIDDNTCRFNLQPRLMDDGSGNFNVVNEPWVVSQIRVLPYIDTSGDSFDIEYVGNDPTNGVFISASGNIVAGIGNSIVTTDPRANTVSYIRDFVSFGNSGNFYLTNDNYSLPVINSWALLGWTEPTISYKISLIDTIDIEPNFDVNIYRKSIYDDVVYYSLENQYPLDDLRNFWYFSDESGKLFLEVKNNFGIGLGNPNKYYIDIVGFRLIDRDIIYTPGTMQHDHVVNFELTSYVNGSNTYFPVDYQFVANSTKVINQNYPLKLGASGDSSSGDYYEVPNKTAIVTFEPILSGEWLTIDYMRMP